MSGSKSTEVIVTLAPYRVRVRLARHGPAHIFIAPSLPIRVDKAVLVNPLTVTAARDRLWGRSPITASPGSARAPAGAAALDYNSSSSVRDGITVVPPMPGPTCTDSQTGAQTPVPDPGWTSESKSVPPRARALAVKPHVQC